MNDWKKAEDIVRKYTGGKFTPGSGNKHIKGDVIVPESGWVIEVKQSNQIPFIFKYEWIEKLKRFLGQKEVAIVIFFGLRGYVYIYDSPAPLGEGLWAAKSLWEDNLPKVIDSPLGTWKLYPLEELKNLNQ